MKRQHILLFLYLLTSLIAVVILFLNSINESYLQAGRSIAIGMLGVVISVNFYVPIYQSMKIFITGS